jgi:hypothetical protein
LTKLLLGKEPINLSQDKFFELEMFEEKVIGEISSYKLDSNGEITRVAFDVSDSFSNITSVDVYGLYSVFYGCTELTGDVSFPNLTSIAAYGLEGAFYGCRGLTGTVSFPKLTSVGI